MEQVTDFVSSDVVCFTSLQLIDGLAICFRELSRHCKYVAVFFKFVQKLYKPVRFIIELLAVLKELIPLSVYIITNFINFSPGANDLSLAFIDQIYEVFNIWLLSCFHFSVSLAMLPDEVLLLLKPSTELFNLILFLS